LLRVLSLGFSAEPVKSVWVTALAVIAVLTMTVGNLAALPQRNLKRMLAYSSVAHAGYMLLGVLALNEAGASGLIVYGFAYTLMTVGAFALLQLLERADGVPATLDEVMGLAHRHPALGWAMVIFMAGLTGIPFTAGFWAKLAVFKAALESGYLWLVIVAVLNSVVSAFYYLRGDPNPKATPLGHRISEGLNGLYASPYKPNLIQTAPTGPGGLEALYFRPIIVGYIVLAFS
jgi:NADH-quinone oxidoreductase subunit N